MPCSNLMSMMSFLEVNERVKSTAVKVIFVPSRHFDVVLTELIVLKSSYFSDKIAGLNLFDGPTSDFSHSFSVNNE